MEKREKNRKACAGQGRGHASGTGLRPHHPCRAAEHSAATCFLSPREQLLTQQLLRGTELHFFGGAAGTERNMCCWLPDYLDEGWLSSEDGPCAAVCAEFLQATGSRTVIFSARSWARASSARQSAIFSSARAGAIFSSRGRFSPRPAKPDLCRTGQTDASGAGAFRAGNSGRAGQDRARHGLFSPAGQRRIRGLREPAAARPRCISKAARRS